MAPDAGPGGWNDPDALIGTSTSAAVHMTQKQSRTQMSLWAMMAAPLEIGSNILNMNAYDLETYMNQEVIDVDQESLGKQGAVFAQSAKCTMGVTGGGVVGAAMDVWTGMTARQRRKRWEAVEESRLSSKGTCTALPDCQQIWTRNLSNGDIALTFVNYTQVLAGVPSSSSEPQETQRGVSAEAGMVLAPCDGSRPEQLWQLGATRSAVSICSSLCDPAVVSLCVSLAPRAA